jgi:hypothetical protein
LPELPDKYEAAAHMFTGSLDEFKTGEKTDTAYSIPVGSPDEGTSVPLWTSDQMRAYALAAIAAHEAEVGRLRGALEKISELDPELHSSEGYNEWGEADCFNQAQTIARAALTQGETK